VALTERLQIIVTADGKGAAREFQQIGATAERELGRTEDRIKKMSSGLISSGSQIALAGGIATAGVFKLAQAAGDYEEAASAAGVIFGDAADDIEDFGKEAIKSAGISRRAAVEAANTFGTFGKAAGLAKFSIDLTQLAGDLASFKNTTTDEAIAAIGAALRGESEPIRRYGVLLDDATLKQEALELGIYDGVGALDQQTKVLAAQSAIFKQTTDAQGDTIRTQDSLANQTRALSAQFENLKVGLGEGAVPIFSELVGAANSALESFQNLSPGTQDLVGRIGAIGAVGATAVGGFAVVAGGVLRLVETFGTLRGSLRDAEGNLTRTGAAATAAGKVMAGAAVVGGVALLADTLFRLSRDAGAAQQALDRFELAIPSGDAEQILSTLNSVGEGYKDLGDALLEPLIGSPVIKTSDDFGVSLANVDRAINDLVKNRKIDEARVALEALEDVKLRPDNAAVLDEINGLLDLYTPRLNDAEAAARGTAEATSFLDQILQASARGQAIASEAADNLAGSYERAGAEAELFASLVGDIDARVEAFSQSIGSSTALDDFLSSGLALNDAIGDLGDSLGSLPDGVDANNIAFQNLGDDATAALRKVLDVGRSVQGVLETTLRLGTAEDVVAEADRIREGLRGVFAQAGITGEQFNQYLEIIGLTPEQVNTAITVSGEAEAKAKLETFRQTAELLEAPIELQVTVAELELQGNLTEASNLVQAWFVDQQDGLIDNPLLVAMGLGDTTEASGAIDDFKRDEEGKPPADIPIGANVDPARAGLNNLRQAIPLFGGSVPVNADISPALANLRNLQRSFPIFGVTGAAQFVPFGGAKPRAVGGPVRADDSYFVNEPSLGGELFRPSTDGFVMNAADTDRLIRGVEALVSQSTTSGGDTINVYEATSARQTAEEVIRMRNAERFLTGASL
jgi:tetratricopeptide (TPR) repeat protein